MIPFFISSINWFVFILYKQATASLAEWSRLGRHCKSFINRLATTCSNHSRFTGTATGTYQELSFVSSSNSTEKGINENIGLIRFLKSPSTHLCTNVMLSNLLFNGGLLILCGLTRMTSAEMLQDIFISWQVTLNIHAWSQGHPDTCISLVQCTYEETHIGRLRVTNQLQYSSRKLFFI